MSRRMTRRQSSTFDTKDLSIMNILMTRIRPMLKNRSLGTNAEQIIHTLDVVPMPMREQGLVHSGFFFGEHGLQPLRPRGPSFARINQDTLMTTANKIGVGSCYR